MFPNAEFTRLEDCEFKPVETNYCQVVGPTGPNSFTMGHSSFMPYEKPYHGVMKPKVDFDPSSFELGSKTNTGFDAVKKPSHYNQHGIEAIKAIEASMSPEEFKGYLKGNFLKYGWRYKYKGAPKQDLEKARWYLDELIKRTD